MAERIGREGFETPREQYVFTRQQHLPVYVLAAIWGLTTRGLEQRLTTARKRGDDWQKARERHLTEISRGVTEVVKGQAQRDTEDLTSNLLAVNGAFFLKISAAIGRTDKPSEIAALTRSLKIVVDLYDTISGQKAQREVFEARREEGDYFAEVVRHYVDDPETARRLAYAVRHRRTMVGVDRRKALGRQIDGVYRAGPVVREAERAVDDVMGD